MTHQTYSTFVGGGAFRLLLGALLVFLAFELFAIDELGAGKAGAVPVANDPGQNVVIANESARLVSAASSAS